MDIREYSLEELGQWMPSLGEKPFRAKQIYEWLHKKMVADFDAMTNLSLALREKLKAEAGLMPVRIVDKRESGRTETCKYLFEMSDGNQVEGVLMRYRHGLSLCISSQVGCRMGCAFCASTRGGLVRNLTAAEMLAQVYEACKDKGERISNVIVMGIGEPLDNYDALLRFVRMVTNADGYHMSQRSITISTCGMLEEMVKLSKEHLAVTLAVSLHAPNDEVRRRLMPAAHRHTVYELLCGCRRYAEATGRRVTLEYAMIRGVTDMRECAEELVERLAGLGLHVNLIPLNEVEGMEYRASDRGTIEDFKKILEKNRINVTIRRGMGGDVMAACGCLRSGKAEGLPS